MTTQHIDTLIIGAGQAGLSTGYHLHRLGREFLIVDAMSRLGDNWRCHYDSLTLYTPVRSDGLPGMSFPGEPWHFPGKDEVADFMERYAMEMSLPIRLQTRVDRLERVPDGGFVAHVGPDRIACANVVVATGTFGRAPQLPDFAGRLDPSIRQLHSTQYKRPDQLLPGPTLVVGASHSGFDIAYEVAVDHPTVLAGPSRGVIPFEWGSPLFRLGYPVLVQLWKHVLTRRTPMGRKEMAEVRQHGGPATRVKPHHLTERGVVRYEHKVTASSADGRPVLADGTVLDVGNIIWATGFRQDFGWIDLPILGADGWPVEYRGVVATAPGLYFCGLAFQYAFSSMVLPGVGRDAAFVAERIAARTPTPQRVPA